MKVLELFAGTRSIGKAFERKGHKVFSIDWDKSFENIDLYETIICNIFQKKYELDPENPAQYKPKGKPVLSTKIDEHIEFKAPWGEIMKIECGGSLILNGPNDIYGIQKSEFEHTYASTGKDKKITLKELLSLIIILFVIQYLI